MREALRDLASEGLIQFDPHRGAVVSELSGDELREIYEIRRLLEPLAMRQAVPNLSEAVLEQATRPPSADGAGAPLGAVG